MSWRSCSLAGARLQVAALVFIVAAVFGNSLLNGFVWDDATLFINQEPYRNFDLKRIFLSRANGLEYLPLRDLSIAFDHLLWGQNPIGFHLTNLAIYILDTVSFFFVLRKMMLLTGRQIGGPGDTLHSGPASMTPFLAALLFAVHPIQAEAVNFITSRNTLLAGLFYLLSLLFFLYYIQETGWSRYLPALLFFVAALLSKATTVALSLVLFSVCRLYGFGMRRAFRATIPFAIVAGIFAALHLSMASMSGVMAGSPALGWSDLPEKLANAFRIPLFYIWKLLCPFGLTIEYQWSSSYGTTAAKLSVAALLCCALTFLWRTAWRRSPAGGIAFVLFFVNLLPVMNLLPTNPVVADRYAFLPSLGFSLGAALLLTRSLRWPGKAALLPALMLTVLLSVLSVRQNLVWKSDITLFEHAVRHAPSTTRLVTDLGRIYFFGGMYDQAFAQFRKAAEMDPRDPNYEYFQGFACLNLARDLPCAREQLTRTLRKRPDFIEALYYLGVTCELEGDPDGARMLYRRAMESRMFDISGLKPRAAERYRLLLPVS